MFTSRLWYLYVHLQVVIIFMFTSRLWYLYVHLQVVIIFRFGEKIYEASNFILKLFPACRTISHYSEMMNWSISSNEIYPIFGLGLPMFMMLRLCDSPALVIQPSIKYHLHCISWRVESWDAINMIKSWPGWRQVISTMLHGSLETRNARLLDQPLLPQCFKSDNTVKSVFKGTSISQRKCPYMTGVPSSQVLWHGGDRIRFWESVSWSQGVPSSQCPLKTCFPVQWNLSSGGTSISPHDRCPFLTGSLTL